MSWSYNRRRTTARSYFNFRNFSLRKTLLLTIVTATFFVTNPANNVHIIPASLRSSFTCASRIPKKKEKKKSGGWNGVYSWNFFGMSIDNSYFCPITQSYSFINSNERRKTKTKETNYGIFSAWTERDTGLHLAFLLQDLTICEFQNNVYGKYYNSSNDQSLCNWLATSLCHGMKAFDGRSEFTALRIIQLLKILSNLVSTCYRYDSYVFYQSPFLSLFRQEYWYNDFISINLFVYPALALLERISAIGTSRDVTAGLHFWVGTFVLVVVFGGLSNMISLILTKDDFNGRWHGMKGSIAACLGYIVAVAPSKIILNLDWLVEIDLTAGDILFGSLGIAFLSHISGIHRYSMGCMKEWSASETIVWIIGGLLGSFFGKWQLDKYVRWWWNPFEFSKL